jgi:succinyl-CoA synthetase beta subunit
MKKYNVPHQRGFVISALKDVKETCQKIEKEYKSKNFIVKSQILAGGI